MFKHNGSEQIIKKKLLTKSVMDNFRFLLFDLKHIFRLVDLLFLSVSHVLMNPFDFVLISTMIMMAQIDIITNGMSE